MLTIYVAILLSIMMSFLFREQLSPGLGCSGMERLGAGGEHAVGVAGGRPLW
jgi:hypothetical protein